MSFTIDQAKAETKRLARTISGLKGVVIETETDIHVIRCEKAQTTKRLKK